MIASYTYKACRKGGNTMAQLIKQLLMNPEIRNKDAIQKLAQASATMEPWAA